MTRTTGASACRVQVYFENPKIERALRREASAGKMPLSRAAEQAIARGLIKRPQADPEDRLLRLERRLHTHMQGAQRDSTIALELMIELARALFLRLPDSPADEQPLRQAAAAARIDRMLDAVSARILAGEAARVSAAVEDAVAGQTLASSANSQTPITRPPR